MATRLASAKSANFTGGGRWLKLRPRVWGLLLLLVGLGAVGNLAWQRNAATIARQPQYLLTADGIHISPPPPWIRSDIKAQVLRDTGLTGTVSVLDDWTTVTRRVKDAFEFHPWIASVERITKRLPAALDIELKYRRPIAAVESRDAHGVVFLPIDEQGVRLPEGDLTDTELRYLPRISGVTGRPLVGDFWKDDRVLGGARLVAALGDVWQQLKLVEIMASLRSQSPEDQSAYTFELVTTGGTRIVWGSAPGVETVSGELSIEEKRRRLVEYATQHGQLDSIDGPASIDLRTDIIVTPRTARQKSKTTAK